MSEYGPAVFDQHASKLRASAVDPEVARERGYLSAGTKADLARQGFSVAQRRPPALMIPLFDVTGERAGAQVRPDEPRMREGKPVKYETKAGQKVVLDVPQRVRPRLGDPARPLVVTEGPIKADAIVSAGLDAVALLGVWSWRGTNDDGGKVALSAWESVALNGRQVFVAFDSDAMLKPQVHAAMERLGGFLESRGAEVAFIYLPPGEAGAKVGADDFLAAGNTAGDLLALATSELRRLGHRPPPRQQRPRAEPRSLEEVDATYRRWLVDVDLGALHAVLGAVVANRAVGDPVWLLLVAPPSAGKTEILLPLAQLPDVMMSGKLTAASLLSATSKKDVASDATGGLLRVIGERGTLLNKDFGTVLAMPRDPRAELLQGLRDVYDGRYDRAVGVDGGRSLTWQGHCGLIAGCVPAIDSHHAVVTALGDRYTMIRLAPLDAGAQARRALAANGSEDEMRRELEAAVCGLLDNLKGELGTLTDEQAGRIADLASLTVRCRSVVDRDPRTAEIVNIPPAELPARFAKQLGRLFVGVQALGAADTWNVVVRCGLDSMPANRRATLEFLAGQDGAVSTSKVGAAIGLPASTVRRTLQDLAAHGVVELTHEMQDKRDPLEAWALSEWCRGLWPGSPDLSGPEGPIEGAHEAVKYPCPISDDFSGEVHGAVGQGCDAASDAPQQAHPSGPLWPTVSYSRLDPCPRCDDGFAVPDPGWAEPACTIKGCGQGTAAPSIDPTARRTSLEAHYEALEHGVQTLADDMVTRGYLVDTGALCAAQECDKADLEVTTAELLAHGVTNPNNSGQVLLALKASGCEFDPRFFNEDGRPSTKRTALNVYAAARPALLPLTTAVTRYRDAKLRSDQLRSLDEAIELGRVHPTVDSHSCESGRMSMSSPNLMGLAKDLRHVIVATPGHVLVRADFDTVEWRVAAALSADPRLIGRVTNDEVDLHSAQATDLFGSDHTPDQRAIAKRLSFGVLYGAGVSGIVKATGLSPSEAKRVRSDIWAAYPALADLAQDLRGKTAVQTPSGRTIRAPAEKDYAFLNHFIQGTARDLLVDALCWLVHAGWAVNVWMLLHDEIVLDVLEDRAQEAVEALNEAMNLDLLGVPITATAEVLERRWR